MDYELSPDVSTSNGTSNISFLLDAEHEAWLRTVTPQTFEAAFGPGEDVDIPSKGYTDPEWYWVASNGNVWGIGWRWGAPRLRGRGRGAMVRPDKLTAYEFIEFLQEELGNG